MSDIDVGQKILANIFSSQPAADATLSYTNDAFACPETQTKLGYSSCQEADNP